MLIGEELRTRRGAGCIERELLVKDPAWWRDSKASAGENPGALNACRCLLPPPVALASVRLCFPISGSESCALADIFPSRQPDSGHLVNGGLLP